MGVPATVRAAPVGGCALVPPAAEPLARPAGAVASRSGAAAFAAAPAEHDDSYSDSDSVISDESGETDSYADLVDADEAAAALAAVAVGDPAAPAPLPAVAIADPAAPPPPAPPPAASPRAPRARRAEPFGPFSISAVMTGGVHTGWGATCNGHLDKGSPLACKRQLSLGHGARCISDDECTMRLKLWLLAGWDIPGTL